MSDLSPKAEPVAWATIVALGLSAAASYGLNITEEFKEFAVYGVPFLLAAIVARFSVYAPDTVKDIKDASRQGRVVQYEGDIPRPKEEPVNPLRPDTWANSNPRAGE